MKGEVHKAVQEKVKITAVTSLCQADVCIKVFLH